MKSAAGEVAIGRADTDDDASTRSTGSLEVEALLAASQRDYEARRNQNNVLRLTEAIRHYSMFLESLDEDNSDEPDPNARADEVNRGAWDSIGDSIAEEEDALNAAEKLDDAVNQAHENFKSGGSYKTFSPSTNNFCRTHVAFYHVSLYLDPKQDFRKYKRESDNKMVHGLWGFLDTARSFDLYRHTMKSRDDPDRRARSRKRTLALTTIWTSKQSMNNLHPVITSSIRGVNTYGHKMMPAYLVGKIEEPVLLAMALFVWRKMSPKEQRLLIAAFKSLTKYEAKLAKDKRDAAAKAGARREAWNARKRQRRQDEKQPPMNSMLLNAPAMANQSASYKHLKVPHKRRKSTSRPQKSSELNDQTATASTDTALRSFAKMSNCITPAPGTSTVNWGTRSAAFLTVDNLKPPSRHPGPSKSRNIVNSAADPNRQTNVNMYLSCGGGDAAAQNLVELLLASGRYDDIARQRVNQLDSALDESLGRKNVNMRIHDAAAIPSLIDADKRSRQSAYRPRSLEEIQQDTSLGIRVRSLPGDFFG
mmetsp:Transcript_18715/g.42380  ORF Transcript_18715/g.42380 Transcript_18715/m.42380 type:complete len:535 (-) Transcript_18715:82-1686(-)